MLLQFPNRNSIPFDNYDMNLILSFMGLFELPVNF
jgi:hypothetical protein